MRDGTGNEPFSVNLLASRKNFSKKPIEQMQVIESLGVLVCLTGTVFPLRLKPAFPFGGFVDKDAAGWIAGFDWN